MTNLTGACKRCTYFSRGEYPCRYMQLHNCHAMVTFGGRRDPQLLDWNLVQRLDYMLHFWQEVILHA